RRSLQHFDLFDLRQCHGEHLPKHKTQRVHIDGSTVDHHEQLVREELIVSPHTDVELGSAHLHNLESGDSPEDCRNICRAGVPNVFIRYHIDIRRRLRDRLFVARGDADGFLFLDQLEFRNEGLVGPGARFFRVTWDGHLGNNYDCQNAEQQGFGRTCESKYKPHVSLQASSRQKWPFESSSLRYEPVRTTYVNRS